MSLSVGLGRRDFRRRFYLGHQVVVPLAFDLEVRGGAEYGGLDQVVRDIGVDAGLLERVERGSCRTATDEPGLQAGFRRVGELAGLPDVVAMAADQMRSAVAIGLLVYDQHGLSDIGGQGVLAGQRADLAVEYDMGWRQRAHH